MATPVSVVVTRPEIKGLTIQTGARGKSAYRSYVETTDDNPVLSEAEWSSLSGNAAYIYHPFPVTGLSVAGHFGGFYSHLSGLGDGTWVISYDTADGDQMMAASTTETPNDPTMVSSWTLEAGVTGSPVVEIAAYRDGLYVGELQRSELPTDFEHTWWIWDGYSWSPNVPADVVRTRPQSFNASEKLQARDNIGVGASDAPMLAGVIYKGSGHTDGSPKYVLVSGLSASSVRMVSLPDKDGTMAMTSDIPTWTTLSGKPSTFPATLGTGATDACAGNDSRLSDPRTPTAHKSSHATGGSDALTPGDIGAARVTELDVRDYGATGDGETDDTNAIHSAMDAAAAMGFSVFFPEGIYKCTIVINSARSRLRILGAGAGHAESALFPGGGYVTRLIPANESLGVFNIERLAGLQISGMEIEGSSYVGGSYSYASQYGIRVHTTDLAYVGGMLVISDCIIKGFKYGFWGCQATAVSMIRVIICQFEYGFYIPTRDEAVGGSGLTNFSHSYWFSSVGFVNSLGTAEERTIGTALTIRDQSFVTFSNAVEAGHCNRFAILQNINCRLDMVGANLESFSATDGWFRVEAGTLMLNGGKCYTSHTPENQSLIRLAATGYGAIRKVIVNGFRLGSKINLFDACVFFTNPSIDSEETYSDNTDVKARFYDSTFTTLEKVGPIRRIFSVLRSTDGQATGQAGQTTYTTLRPNTIDINEGGSYDASTGRFYPRKYGKFRLSACLGGVNIPNGGIGFYVTLNGSTRYRVCYISNTGSAYIGTLSGTSPILKITPSDYLEVELLHYGTSTIAAGNNYQNTITLEEIKP